MHFGFTLVARCTHCDASRPAPAGSFAATSIGSSKLLATAERCRCGGKQVRVEKTLKQR